MQAESLIAAFRSRDMDARVVSFHHLDEIIEDVDSLHKNGLMDEQVYAEYSPWFLPAVAKGMENARSIIIAAIPQPMHVAAFQWKGLRIDITVPPTYAMGEEAIRQVEKTLEETSQSEPHSFVRSKLPLKTLAVRSGLATYGRNNISYIEGMGSYHRLTAFCSDWENDFDDWQERKLADKCEKCSICFKECPTGAIGPDRVLLHTERCLTFHNERDAKVAFPSWIASGWHNSLVGCMRCQQKCPMNKGKLRIGQTMEFTEEETQYLLKGDYQGEAAKRIEQKLKKLGLDLSVFPRNLQPFLDGY